MIEFTQNQIDFISTKKIIDQKTELSKSLFTLLADFGKDLQEQYSSQLQFSKAPKVSKGENYNGYPYMVVDYPRIFEIKDVFAFRTLFWWGNYFSSSLHLKGKYLSQFESKIPEIIKNIEGENKELFISNHGNEWDHNLFSEQYFSWKKSSSLFKNNLLKGEFLKLSLHLPLSEINNLDDFLKDSKQLLLKPLL